MPSKEAEIRVVVAPDGPYIVTGNVPLSQKIIGTDAKGDAEEWLEGKSYPARQTYALCRCGESKKKPFCDGTHAEIGFDGTETASRELYAAQAKVFDGPAMRLTDVRSLCAFGRYCDPNGKVWQQVAHTDQPEIRARFIRQVENCPAGRLVAWDKTTGQALEPELPVSIGLIEDPQEQCSGPIWLRGGIAVTAADGFAYEVRNRVTLCRCGRSNNKPFCDGMHATIKFRGE
jgi:CDGSH-type Zn-finger protein